ncbi:hypothetical protein [Kitasatospora sp. MAP5-34]|uniref:hypothetical protein n=1 Tax=Kitasatospora sp. MAP5-34 TaxID=3035102 RepID=UPI002475B7CE|nr:hypothetical protein [Kitasatospora sp. MAP5-34]MDH6579552.1 hypothetical protein [Kitasatospora sp. MAP5-34]
MPGGPVGRGHGVSAGRLLTARLRAARAVGRYVQGRDSPARPMVTGAWNARVFGLALATGTRARITRSGGGRYRVQASLPQGLHGDAQLTVLKVLARAGRYGHHYRPDAQAVWAELT